MYRKAVAVWVSLLIMVSSIVILVEIADRVEAPTTLYVGGAGGGNYSKIQWAIDNASSGDTVFVYNGTYYENIVVNKTLNLSGEDKDNVILRALPNDNVITISSDWVNVTGFTVTRGSLDPRYVGIILNYVENCGFTDNNLTYEGICITGDQLSHHNSHYIPMDNLVNGRPILYYKDSNGFSIDGIEVGQLIITNCTDIDVKNLNILNTSFGIDISFSANIWITNTNITNNSYGIYYSYSTNNNITNNVLFSNTWCAISLISSSNNNIIDNEISSDQGPGIYLEENSDENIIMGNNISAEFHYCIYLYRSSNNVVIGNNFSAVNFVGIYINDSPYTVLENNSFYYGGVFISGWRLSHFNSHTIPINNVLNGKPIYYFKNNNSVTLDGIPVGQLILANCNNFVVRNLQIIHTYVGIEMIYSSRGLIEYNDISLNSGYGIFVRSSYENNFTFNNITNNNYGIDFIYSAIDNIVSNNNMSNNSKTAMVISSSSKNNLFFGNNVTNNWRGLWLISSNNNYIIENNFSFNNQCALSISSSSNNWIYHNNFVDNTNQAQAASNYINMWDKGYPPGGNYWSDYTGFDNNKGPYQNIPGSDDIGDTNYTIASEDNVDNYPLIGPYIPKHFENSSILKQGWNLISIPLIQDNQTLGRILEMIEGYYNAVQWFDNTDPIDPWKHHKIGKPFGNDLSELNETMSFWIHITQPGEIIFLYNGTEPTIDQTIPIHPGWNMVGYPSLSNHNRTTGLNNLTFDTHVDCIQWFDAAAKTWHFMGPDDSFVPGRGYWVHSKVEVEWEVPL